jgi:hypothetical protein
VQEGALKAKQPDHDRAGCGIDVVISRFGLAMVRRSFIKKGCGARPLSQTGKITC